MNHGVLIIKNTPHENPGILENILQQNRLLYEIVDLERGDKFPQPDLYHALIILGGPDSANDKTKKMKDEIAKIGRCLELQIPYLGICLGMQILVKAAGGMVVKSPVKEVGFSNSHCTAYRVHLTAKGKQDPLFIGMGPDLRVFQLHGETVVLNNEMVLLGQGDDVLNQVVRVGRNAYGVQCHFELTREMLEVWHTKDADLRRMDSGMLLNQFDQIVDEYTQVGEKLIRNFLRIAKLL